MTSTVVSVHETWNRQLEINLSRAPMDISKGPLRPTHFPCTPDELIRAANDTPDEWVKIYGQSLWTALRGHKAIDAALTHLLRTPMGSRSPLFFQTDELEGERFHWETLCYDDEHFLALDNRWPICRIATPAMTWEEGKERHFTPPLRVMAVLSADQVPALREWQGLEAAFEEHADDGLSFRLHVLVSEKDLYQRIRARAGVDKRGRDLKSGKASWLSVEMVPNRTSLLLRRATDFQPHVLHLFCHGSAAARQPFIEIATPKDWYADATGEPSAPLRLDIGKLIGCTAFPQLWLAVLNCCEGGATTGEVQSLTGQLVSYGLPAAIGMREPISQEAATEFSGVFYAALLPDLVEDLAGTDRPGGRVELDWGRLLADPRSALAEMYNWDAAGHKEWALPIMYVAEPTLRIKRVSERPGSALQREETIAGAIEIIPNEITPPEVVQALQSEIDDVASPQEEEPDEGEDR